MDHDERDAQARRLIDRRRLLLLGCGAGAALALPRFGRAAVDDYPNKMIRVIVPYPPGGPTDIVARIVGPRLGEVFQQTVVLDNRPGASGMIGEEVVARAPRDGYTLLINVSGQLVNPALYVNMSHDPLKDFTPITDLASTPIQLVVRGDSPVKTVKDLVDLVRSQPGRHSYAISSIGTPGHLAGEVFKAAAGLDTQVVPYKGSAPALTDVIGGHVTYMTDSMPSGINMVRSGQLRALAITSAERSKLIPDVPTFTEAGYPTVNLSTWYGMWAPAATPAAVTRKLNLAVAKILQEPEIRAKLEAVQLTAVGDTLDHFAAFCQSESVRYENIVKSASIRIG